MNQDDIDFINELKKHWLGGKTEKTPTEILVNIPSCIYRLLSIIDKLQSSSENKEKIVSEKYDSVS